MNPDELTAELSDQGVVAVHNIKQRRDGIERITPVIILTFRTPTPVIILTFRTPTPPKEIFAEYLAVKVDVYVPNPLRCFKCQQFGHHQSACKRSVVCPKCSMAAHGEEPCTNPVKCVNCSGDHPTYATTCPRWVQEKEVCRIKVTSNVSFPDARRIVTGGTGNISVQRSYAATVTQRTFATVTQRTIATQTDVTNCTCTAPITTQNTSETQTDTETTKSSTNTASKQGMKQDTTNSRKSRENAPQGAPANRVARSTTSVSPHSGCKSGACGTSADLTDHPTTGNWDTVAGPSGQWANVPNRKHLKDRGKFPSSSKTDDRVNMTTQARDNVPRQAIGYP
jgi:hypothetical protein